MFTKIPASGTQDSHVEIGIASWYAISESPFFHDAVQASDVRRSLYANWLAGCQGAEESRKDFPEHAESRR